MEFIRQSKPEEANSFDWLSDIHCLLSNASTHFSADSSRNGQQNIPGIPLFFWVPIFDIEKISQIVNQQVPSDSTCRNCHICPAEADWNGYLQMIGKVFQFHENFKEKYFDFLRNINVENYLLYVERELAGTGSLNPSRESGSFLYITMLPQYRKISYIRSILKILIDKAIELSYRELILLTSDGEKIYENLGFKRIFNIAIFPN